MTSAIRLKPQRPARAGLYRTRPLLILLTPQEKEVLRRIAHAAGYKSMAAYIRAKCLPTARFDLYLAHHELSGEMRLG